MAQSKIPDLVLSVGCQEDRLRGWVLNPQGHNGFRIIVHCRRAKGAPPPKPRSWFSYFGAIAQAMLPVFALWRRED